MNVVWASCTIVLRNDSEVVVIFACGYRADEERAMCTFRGIRTSGGRLAVSEVSEACRSETLIVADPADLRECIVERELISLALEQ